MTNTMKVAIFLMASVMIYMFGVTFLPDTWINDKLSNRIVTYMQTILTWLLGYYWGTSTKTGGASPPEIKNENEKENGNVQKP